MYRCGTALAALALALAGCGPARSYRVIRINGVPGIAPPVYKDGDSEVKLKIPGVRAEGAGACPVASPQFRIAWKAGDAVISVNLGVLFPGGAYDEAAHRAFEAFRVELERLEQRDGCLRAGATRLIAQRVAEALPVPFQEVAFYRNRYDPYGTWVDLEPGMRLLRQTVVLDEGRGSSPRFETTEYRLLEGPSNGVRFAEAPDGAPDLPYQRLFLRTTFSAPRAAGAEQHATLLSAPDLRTMEELTARFEENAAAVCDVRPSPCTVFPNRVTMAPEIPVHARSVLVYVDPLSSVGDVLKRVYSGAPPKNAIRTLSIDRPFAGGFARIDLKRAGALALRLPVVAGDRLHWSE